MTDAIPKIYLLSEEFDYGASISDAFGHGYAERLGLETDVLSAVRQYPDRAVVFDSRISESECAWLEPYVTATRDSIFIFRTADPWYGRPYWLYQLLHRVVHYNNIFWLSTCHITGLLKELDEAAPGRGVVIPFPFRDRGADPFSERRLWKIVFSGRYQNKFKYPYRSRFYKKIRRSFWHRPRVDILEHPGYPDAGHEQLHDVTGEDYIDHLSDYAFAFLTPSRWRIELLKYLECAEARCVPVGIPPDPFCKDMNDAMVRVDLDSVGRSLRRILSMPYDEAADRSRSYYEAVRRHRAPGVLRHKLDEFLRNSTFYVMAAVGALG